MPKRVYYGSYQSQRKRDNKKRFLIVLAVLIVIGIIIWFSLFFGTLQQRDLGDMMKGSVTEITQLKLQLEEKDDEIAALNQKIAEYEAELALRPTLAPTPIPPPNDTVLAGQATPVPTRSPVSQRRPVPTVAPIVQEPVQEQIPQQVPQVQEPVQDIQPQQDNTSQVQIENVIG